MAKKNEVAVVELTLEQQLDNLKAERKRLKKEIKERDKAEKLAEEQAEAERLEKLKIEVGELVLGLVGESILDTDLVAELPKILNAGLFIIKKTSAHDKFSWQDIAGSYPPLEKMD
jgi:uncharacterized membrane protein YdbT with pleckstrin-like domain